RRIWVYIMYTRNTNSLRLPRLTRNRFFLGVMICFPCFAQLGAPPKQSKKIIKQYALNKK
ncbi:MAG: hypothetical protein KA783_12585, partial [Chitinophagales bacterium]|nr:hypothetical protein [Chitinophagales bacterium]